MSKSLRNLLMVCGLALALLSGACGAPQQAEAPVGPKITPAQESRELIRLGEAKLKADKPEEASYAFLAALSLKPPPEETARARFGLANAQDRQGMHGEALRNAQLILAEQPYSPLAAEVSLLAARQEIALGRHQAAAARLNRLVASKGNSLTPTQLLEAKQLSAGALSKGGRPSEAVRSLMDQARSAGPGMAAEISGQLATTAAELSTREIEPLLAGARLPEVRAALLMALARAALREGSLSTAQEALRRVRSSPQAPVWINQVREMEAQLGQAKQVKPHSVGVILPFSGNYAGHGKKALAAVELGLGLFGGPVGLGGGRITLHIEDSASDPQATAAALNRLITQRRVMVVIGPLAAQPSLAAARKAQQSATPIITLSQLAGVTGAGDYVFQNFSTPDEQVQAVLDEAMTNRGLARMAVMAPQNSYGRGFERLFAKEVENRGGKVVKTVFYDPQAADFTGEIKKLVNLPPGRYRPGHPESPKPVISFDAVFIPDSGRRAGMVAAQLAYFDVTSVALLGTSLWRNPELLETAGRYLKNCIFPGAFDPNSSLPQVKNFVSEFHQAVASEPDLLDAHAYDAAVLVRSILASSQPPQTREAFRQALTQARDVPGVCGVMSMGPDRRVLKRMQVFTVRKGRFSPLYGPDALPAEPETPTPAPSADAAPGAQPAESPAPGFSPPQKAPAATILR